MQDTTVTGAAPRLDAAAITVFERALLRGGIDRGRPEQDRQDLGPEEFAQACELLLRLRLLRPQPQRPDVLVPISPELAAAGMVAPLEEAIAQAEAQVRTIREEFDALMPRYRSSRRHPARWEAVEVLPDPVGAAAVLADAAANCRGEVLAVCDGGGPAAGPLGATRTALAVLARGGRLRTLCRAATQGGRAQREDVRTLVAAGAEYRTLPELPDAATVIDRSTAFLVRRGPDGCTTTVLVRDADTVAYLCQTLDLLWAAGSPYPGPAGPAPARSGAGLHRAVVRMLAEGAKDEVIARRLGVSLRTCRRHIAEILDGVGAESRFQGGVLAERAGLTGPG